MKIRNGYVSNSSSSSFICDVCGHETSGWDMCLSEVEMCECVNGHVFCEDHLVGDYPEDDDDGEFRYDVPENQCPICSMNIIRDVDGYRFLKQKYNETDETILSEIKEKYSSYKDFSKGLNK